MFVLSIIEPPASVWPAVSDDSSYPSANMTFDGIQPTTITVPSFWTQPVPWLRGGFCYPALVSDSPELAVANVSFALSFTTSVMDLHTCAAPDLLVCAQGAGD
jgi:hypothetical protein